MRIKLLHRFIPALLSLVSLSLSAQTASEISAAKNIARSYGYSDKEINDIINRGSSYENTASQAPDYMSAPLMDTLFAGSRMLPVSDSLMVDMVKIERPVPVDSMEIYGHSYFSSPGLSVIPSYNAPVPEAYVLGPGDELVIDIWGATVSHVVSAIGIDGSISVPDLGLVYVSGMTVSNAERLLNEQLGRIYSGLSGSSPDTFMRLSLGRIKGVSVSVAGEVKIPGLYSIPSLATIPSVIFMAGGINEKGSVRSISVFRHGRKVADFDLYDFLFRGKFNENLRLQDGDVINVGAYRTVVSVGGAVMRPMRYELLEGETIQDVIVYADGFDLNAQRTGLHVHRKGVLGNRSFDVSEADFATFRLFNGDRVSIRSYNSNDLNSVTITGPVRFPGHYAIDGNVKDLASLIEFAGGVVEGTYTDRGMIRRLDEDRIPEVVTFNLAEVLSGKTEVRLEKEDSVFIFLKSDLVEKQTVTIEGHVRNPGTYAFSDGMTVGDLILQAQGVRGDVYSHRGQIRRISSEGVPVLEAFSVDDAVSGRNNVLLAREDTVRIYSFRELREDATVNVGGAVNAPGTFKYYERMTLEDLLLTAGGLSNGADMRNIQISTRGGRERGSVEIVDIENNPEMLTYGIQPYDVVSVRVLTYFRDQITITVNGEVISPGPYAFDDAEVRLSEVMSRVGGFSDAAYVHGATLTRVLTKEEKERQKIAVMIANQNLDEKTQFDTLLLTDRFKIGIDMNKALDNPGSAYDVTLRSGDIISVPVINNTVKVSGGVFYPNTVSYNPSFGWRDYVNMAGGFTKLARKGKIYAVYMNGNVAVGNKIKCEPGMELVIPERKKSEGARLTPVEIASIATSMTSLATLVTTLMKLF
ncbi:MAG: SLBB domain-containing protein [Bacteroidales bacterium]|nr:SLBB domain-containing protein [Bacteroidales bacterium]